MFTKDFNSKLFFWIILGIICLFGCKTLEQIIYILILFSTIIGWKILNRYIKFKSMAQELAELEIEKEKYIEELKNKNKDMH